MTALSHAPMSSKTSPPRRRWHVGWWMLGFALVACAWAGWREYDFRAAIREAKAAGWQWETRDPVTLILADWRAVGRKETWTFHYRRVVHLPEGTNLAVARPLLARLRPTYLFAEGCPNPDLNAFRGLPALQHLYINDCTALQNVDAFRGLSGLQWLDLRGCSALQNVDGLRWLPALLRVELNSCTGLQNVDVLLSLPALDGIGLQGCTGLSASTLRELQAALPKTQITFTDGSLTPPP